MFFHSLSFISTIFFPSNSIFRNQPLWIGEKHCTRANCLNHKEKREYVYNTLPILTSLRVLVCEIFNIDVLNAKILFSFKVVMDITMISSHLWILTLPDI